jgi:predicted MFS family arabinose efflux permease
MNPPYRLWQVFLPFAAAYFLSYVMRTANAVLSAPLTEEFGLSASDLGLLSSAYFLAFAAMQLPLGSLLDRRGPRHVEVTLLIFAIIGCLISALATGFITLWIGRALIGIGVCACLMAAYKAFRQCFSADRQVSLASLMLVIGSLGSLAATLPIELLLPALGWRGVFLLTAVLFAFSAAAIYWLLPALPTQAPISSRYWKDTFSGIATIFSHPGFRRYLPFAVFMHGGFLAVQSLWIGPWLRTVYGMQTNTAATVLLVLAVVVMCAHLTMSAMATQFTKWKWQLDHVLLGGSCLMVIMTVAAAFDIWGNPILGWSLMFFTTGITGLIYAKVALLFPVAMAGRANTAINFVSFTGAFAMQWGIGLLIDLFGWFNFSLIASYKATFLVWVLLQCFAVAWMFAKRQAQDPLPGEVQSPR